jgi:polar amino acid transport system substrate-binding protein
MPLRSTLARSAWLFSAVAMSAAAAAAGDDTGSPVPLCFTEFAPYVSADLPDGGSLGALARRAFAAEALPVQIHRVPWARAIAMARKGECIILALWRNEERDAAFRYSLPVAQMQLGLFVRSGQSGPLKPGARVAFERGSYLPDALTHGGYRLSPVVDVRPALNMLALDRVDAVFSERLSLEHLIAKEGRLATNIRWMGAPLEVKTTYMAISKEHPQADIWLDLLNRQIRSLTGTDRLRN